MGSLDVANLSHSSRPQCCLWGWVGCTASATLVKAGEGKDLPAQHPETGSELGLCLQSSDHTTAMQQMK